MKHGFMLIELIIVTLIASMIGTLLLTALSQGARFQKTVDVMVDMSLRVGIFSNQFEKDFTGAFIPMQARLKEETEETGEAECERTIKGNNYIKDKKLEIGKCELCELEVTPETYKCFDFDHLCIVSDFGILISDFCLWAASCTRPSSATRASRGP